jgi:hypothetical protein
MTIAELAERLKPAPGNYEVVVQHPVTRRPVTVAFALPDGTPRRVRALPRQLVFVYDHHSVRLRFTADGRVTVTSR